jgi:CubicO group peptidase (beta-lactamase class C family)
MKFSRYSIFFLLSIGLFFSCKKDETAKKIILKTPTGNFSTINATQKKLPKLSSSFINSKKREIEKFYQKNWPENDMNGGFLVAKNGQIIFEKYAGIANVEKQLPITNKTPLHIASVSKVITATAVLLLIDSKKISLDQKVNTILKDFPFEGISIKNLLSHRSGLKNYPYFTDDEKVWNHEKILTNQDVLNVIISQKIPLGFETNTKFSYCNTNYAILALVIEKITGIKYPDAMKKMIFEPLQMNDSYVYDFDNDHSKSAPSYKSMFQKIPLDYLDKVYGDKNVYSTPRDLLKLDLARRSGDFVNPELEKMIYKGYSYEHKGTKNYGLGIRMIEWETGEPFYFHNGWWHGNTSSYITLGKEKVTLIALSNKFTTKTYAVRKLSSLFGDYPFQINDSID